MKKVIHTIIILLVVAWGGYGQTLDDYFKIAAENNPGLKASYKTFEAAMEKIPQVSTLPDPSFSFGYFISPVETRVGPQRARFSLSQMFPWFGTLQAKGEAAALTAEAAYQSFLDERNRLKFQVASAYYPLYELENWILLERENIEILESYKSIATRKFENGNSPMVDVLRVDIMLKDAQTRIQILQDKKLPLLSAFNNLLNRDETAGIKVSDTLNVDYPTGFFNKDSLLHNNPVLTELDFRIRASEANEVVAQKQGLPNFGIGLDYVVVGEPSGMVSADNGKDVIMPMLSVSIPIFRKKYKAAEREAQLMQESFSYRKENALNTLSSEFDRARFSMQQQHQLAELYDEQILTTQQSLNLLFTAYGNSGKEFEEVLRMQQQLLQYEKSKATALSEFQVALARINYLTANSINNENK